MATKKEQATAKKWWQAQTNSDKNLILFRTNVMVEPVDGSKLHQLYLKYQALTKNS